MKASGQAACHEARDVLLRFDADPDVDAPLAAWALPSADTAARKQALSLRPERAALGTLDPV